MAKNQRTARVGKSRNDDSKDAWRAYQPRKRTAQDYETAAALLQIIPPNEVQKQRARYTLAHFARDADEAKEFMLMLGIFPDPPKRIVTQK